MRRLENASESAHPSGLLVKPQTSVRTPPSFENGLNWLDTKKRKGVLNKKSSQLGLPDRKKLPAGSRKQKPGPTPARPLLLPVRYRP